MNAGVMGQNVILLKAGSVAVLYDLTEKKVLKQINLANCTNNTVATRPTTYVAMCSGIVLSGMPSSLNKTPISHFTFVHYSAYKYGS